MTQSASLLEQCGPTRDKLVMQFMTRYGSSTPWPASPINQIFPMIIKGDFINIPISRHVLLDRYTIDV
jgi:hypothetical protein